MMLSSYGIYANRKYRRNGLAPGGAFAIYYYQKKELP